MVAVGGEVVTAAMMGEEARRVNHSTRPRLSSSRSAVKTKGPAPKDRPASIRDEGEDSYRIASIGDSRAALKAG